MKNNEITIKISVSDDMLSAISNILLLSNAPVSIQGLLGTKPPTALPPPSPIGFRAKGRE
jgi:hypothetical protein